MAIIAGDLETSGAGLGDFVGAEVGAGGFIEVGEGAGGTIGGENRFRELELDDLGWSGCGWTSLSLLLMMLVTWSLEMMGVGLFDCIKPLDGGGNGLGVSKLWGHLSTAGSHLRAGKCHVQ